uniref:HTH_Tnp_Tc3_1 domain-containing protein n=1 Tax=Caenorhabditis japonica TaxID=281687 RepID=A0A8R1I7C8_CAEJA
MGRGKTVTMPERAQVDLMFQLNMFVSLMSTKSYRSQTVINCYISDPVAYRTSKSTGRPRKLKQRDENTTESFQINYFANNPKIWKHHAPNQEANSISELTDAVKAKWSKIHPSYLDNLSNSRPNRIFQVIQKNGGFTSY